MSHHAVDHCSGTFSNYRMVGHLRMGVTLISLYLSPVLSLTGPFFYSSFPFPLNRTTHCTYICIQFISGATHATRKQEEKQMAIRVDSRGRLFVRKSEWCILQICECDVTSLSLSLSLYLLIVFRSIYTPAHMLIPGIRFPYRVLSWH